MKFVTCGTIRDYYYITIIIIIIIIAIVTHPGPALVSSETDQGALEQATERILGLRIEGPCTERYCRIRIHT